MMEVIHKLLNIFLPFLSTILFIFVFPPLSVFNFFNYFYVRSVSPNRLDGKVILITGASSGIGEHLAYEYGRRGACLALVARRKEQLEMVARKAKEMMGSPDVIAIPADVSKVEDCKRFVDEAVNHFGTLDHLVNNAGIATAFSFSDNQKGCASDHTNVMDINFWGSVYTTQFAVPHLKRSKGKITVISSCASWFPMPNLSIYSASKAAQVSFFETLRIELGSDVGITIINPGFIKSAITDDDEFLSAINGAWVPLESTEKCAKAIVDSACRGDMCLTEPAWVNAFFKWKMCPQVLNWAIRFGQVNTVKSFSHDSKSK